GPAAQARDSGGALRAAEQDTGPIALIAPPEPVAHLPVGDLPPWPVDTPAGALAGRPADAPADTRFEAPPGALAPRMRRGVGLLLVGTALGMLAGAVSLVLR
ncbi:MAG TPA: hypothetical protein VNU01_07330, partial [Egibacteraceae bacterium]|nr:hypothetical protein [Egibacteraceae bacterium]